jgi:hypothetical protein
MPRPPKKYKELDEIEDDVLNVKEDGDGVDENTESDVKEIDDPKDDDVVGGGGGDDPIFKIAGEDDSDDDFIPGAIRRNKPPKPMWSDDVRNLKFNVGDLVCFKSDEKCISIYKVGQCSPMKNHYEITQSGSNISRSVCADLLVKAPKNRTWDNFWEIKDPYLMWKKAQEAKKLEESKLKDSKKTPVKKKAEPLVKSKRKKRKKKPV